MIVTCKGDCVLFRRATGNADKAVNNGVALVCSDWNLAHSDIKLPPTQCRKMAQCSPLGKVSQGRTAKSIWLESARNNCRYPILGDNIVCNLQAKPVGARMAC
jgi:hypothetical protein